MTSYQTETGETRTTISVRLSEQDLAELDALVEVLKARKDLPWWDRKNTRSYAIRYAVGLAADAEASVKADVK